MTAFTFDRTVFVFGSNVDILLEQKEWVDTDKKKGKGYYKPRYTLEETFRMVLSPPNAKASNGMATVMAMMNNNHVTQIAF